MSAIPHNPASKSNQVAPVQDFLASLEALERHATRVEKLPRARLLEQLSASKSPWSETRALLRHIGTITRRFEQIRQRLQDEEVDQLAVAASRKAVGHLAELVERGELLEPAQFADRLSWTRQALSKALTARRVFFVEVQGARYYPAFFADTRYERRHLEAVSRALGDLPGATKLMFLTTPKGSLGGLTSLQALAKGKPADVMRAAEGFAQR
jgi:hypothetical protein